MLSIIIPTLNEEKYLPKLLDCIKIQDFKDYEIIVADAGSKDKTVEIAKKYGCQVVKGGLLPAGRNRGAEVAKGDIFLFLDADIILPPTFLKKSVEEFKRRHLGIAGFKIVPMSDRFMDKFWHSYYNFYSWMLQKISPHSMAAIMSSREAHGAIGGFDEEIVFVEDYSYTKAVTKVAKYGLINQPFFVCMRRYEKDGRWNVWLKYFLAELHILFIGPIKSDIFKYKFGHYEDSSTGSGRAKK